MFTRCPACDTTFRLGAGDLRRAQGRVRCGECSSVFNALEYLAEEPEEAAAPDSWLPEPANDAIHPHDSETVQVPTADIDIDAFDFELDTDSEDDDEKSDTAIFVTDPDDDGFSYATRTFGTGDAATTNTTPDAAEPSADDRGDNLLMPVTILAAEPATADLAENIDDPDFSMPQDLDSAFNAEPISASRWNEALQELEKAETGTSFTVANRSDYLSPEELADSTDAPAELNPPLSLVPAEPEEIEPVIEEDFDDTIWERIPGVGSLGTAPGRPIGFGPDSSSPLQPDEPASQPDLSTGIDADDLDPLEFNAPEETWSEIFISSSPALPDDDDEEFSGFLIEDEDEDLPDTDNSDTDSESTDDASDMARLEQIFNPERIAAMLQERAAGDSSAAKKIPAPATHLVNAHAPGTVFDNPARQLGVKAWLTDDEKSETPEADEFPAEGYDVQHIILADESETPDVQNATNTAAVRKHELPAWQANAKSAPARKGLWLIGSLLLVAALLSQLIHYNRDSLAASPTWGSTVVNAYSMIERDIFPAWSLDDYEIRSAEAVAGESGADIMDIRAQIAVIGTKPTGLPYLRVVLSDRWSKPVAEKIFGPADYAKAGGLKLDRLLRPGENIEVHVSIVDPGAGAQGFELELCMPRRHTGMACTGQPFK